MKPHVWLDMEQDAHHGDADHPEAPARIIAIQQMLDLLKSETYSLTQLIEPIPRALEPAGSNQWFLDNGDTYCTEYTPILLKRGRQMIEEAVYEIAIGSTDCAFVCIRPPGHHANSKGVSSGFCHQNNTWIAIDQLRLNGFHSIGIFDWDAHHGDGTEDCVRVGGDPLIRFVSMHAYGPNVYPGTGLHSTDRILNIPLPVGTDSETYVGHFHEKVLPFLKEGAPDVLIVSAGYDGHKKDPMALLQLRENTYTHMSHQLKDFDCPILFLLEGGYNPKVLASCVQATLRPWLSSASGV